MKKLTQRSRRAAKEEDGGTHGILPVFLCLVAAIAVMVCYAGCAGTQVSGSVATRYGKFTYDSKGTFAK